MAVKKVATKKAVAKKAVAKKAVAKKAPAKKAVAKKAVATKAPAKKAVAKKAVAKKAASTKAPVKKAPAKKATVKKAVVKKTATRTTPSRLTFDTLAPISNPTTPVQATRPKFEAPAPKSTSTAAPVSIEREGKGKSKGLFVLVGLIILGSLGYFITSGASSSTSAEPTPMASPTESATAKPTISPSAEASPEVTEIAAPVEVVNKVKASFTYTSTGIRLAWNVEGGEIASIRVSSSEDDNDFIELTSLASDARALRIIKTDTTGWTKFKVTISPVEGDEYSTTVGLRGRFTL